MTLSLAIILCSSVSANDLNLTKGSWDTVGLDHNNVNDGPNEYNIQIHVTNNGSAPATNVTSTFTWTSSNANIALAPGETTTKNLGTINPGQTVDVFYLVRVNRTSAAYDTLRNYTISVSGTNTPVRNINGSLYVQKLVSQNRNDVLSITTSNPTPTIGETFAVTVVSRTASSTYDIVNLPLSYNPALVKPLSYFVSYGSTNSTNIRLNNPGTTDFVSVWIFQALAAGQNTFLGIITDQSGNSYHYNGDYGESNIIQVTPKADLAIVKTVCHCDRTVGQTINYVLTVTNNGPNNATGVIVKDIIPTGLNYLYSTPGDNVTYNPTTRLLTWSIGPLNVGSTAVLQIFATLMTPGEIINTAEVNGTEFDPDTSNNYSTVIVNAEQKTADLGVSKTANNKMPHIGDSVTYTVTVTNGGPDDATGVTVTDNLLNGLEFVSASVSQGSYSYNPITKILTWNVGNLAREASATLEIVVKVLQEGVINNTAIVTGNETDPNPNNNNSTETINVQPVADLKITKDVDVREPSSGQTVNFTITVQNLGPSNATNVTVIDVLPEGLNFISFVGTPSATYDPVTRTITWNIGNLEYLGSAVLEFNATYQPAIPGSDLNNTATVNSTTFDPDLTNNQATTSLNGQFATLNIQKTVDISQLHVGDTATFTINLTNNGPDTANGVTITDVLPEGFIFDSFVSWTAGRPNPAISSGTITWNLGDLLNGETVSLVFKATANKTGFWTNIATANSTTPPDTDSSGVTVEILPVADVGVIKTVSNTTPLYGQNVTYTITATNYGPNNATGIIIQDILASNRFLIYVGHSMSQGTFDPVSKIWNVGDLTYLNFATLNITFKVNATGQINNTATKTFANELDPNTSNDAASVTLNVPSAADLSITKTVSNPKPYIHEVITSTLIVQNHGPDTATGVYVVDKLPDGLKYISSSANYGSYDPLTGIWTIGDLPNGAIAVLNIRTAVEKIGPLENHAHVYSSTYDPILNNQAASANVDVQATPVNAATVPMQPTGLPIGYLAIAVLMVLAGIIIPKRK
ncbi:hypothetical protein [Methanobacterium oryzae]|uniref:hypothetical protein n=1 Tax=Methanobacterium oryzae TaxID=69540 RepID=UPI003D1A0EAC